jgi:bacterioferritin-associated ferredoxin
MIICSCNAIRDCDLRAAADRGCHDAEAAYRSMGCDFQCGGCRDLADEVIVQTHRRPALIKRSAA